MITDNFITSSRILVNSDVINYRKLPFIRILTWTYLVPGSGSNAVCSDRKDGYILLLVYVHKFRI